MKENNLRYDPIHPDVPPIPEPPLTALTPNYNYLLVLGDTVTSWLTIFNTNMSKIDNDIHDITLRTSIDGNFPPEAIEDIIRLNEKVSTLQDDIHNAKENIQSNTESITNLQTQSTTNTTDISTLKINYVNLDTRVSTLETRVQSLETTLEKLQNNYNSLEGRVSALESTEVS